MPIKNITILGSTGSIGTQTLDAVRNLEGRVRVCCLSANKNTALLSAQIAEFQPHTVCVMEKESCEELKKQWKGSRTQILYGMEGLVFIATHPDIHMVVNAVVGNIGLIPTVAAIEAGKDIALANKETLVSAGALVMEKAAEHGVKLLPVDSEHSAIFQCLQGNEQNPIEKIYLTASGGPFRTMHAKSLAHVTLEDALKHPNWQMGQKITVDSSTLMNKGLEVIEAKWLFGIDLDRIEVVVHPQSIIHSMVEFADGSVMAQLGAPDMRLPISYALTYPKRPGNNFKRLNLYDIGGLTFEKPRYHDFPALGLAYKALETGGTMPAVLNGANEAAVSLFIEKKIGFQQIPSLIQKAMDAYTVKHDYTLDDVLDADRWARDFVIRSEV